MKRKKKIDEYEFGIEEFKRLSELGNYNILVKTAHVKIKEMIKTNDGKLKKRDILTNLKFYYQHQSEEHSAGLTDTYSILAPIELSIFAFAITIFSEYPIYISLLAIFIIIFLIIFVLTKERVRESLNKEYYNFYYQTICNYMDSLKKK